MNTWLVAPRCRTVPRIPRRDLRRILVLLAGAAAAGAPLIAARAQDRVSVRPEGFAKPFVVEGTIEEYNARKLTIRPAVGAPLQSHLADSIEAVETSRLASHTRGLAALEAGDLDTAEQELDSAALLEQRHWVRQEIIAALVRCARRRGDRIQAVAYFRQIIAIDPETRFWSSIPLVWTAESHSRDLLARARAWLIDEREAIRLVGASLLLLDDASGPQARTALSRLARSSDEATAALARAQQWRLRLVAADLSATELALWRDRIESMPPSLRGGPMSLLARASVLRGDYAQAAEDWLWIPLVYNDDEPLAARAALDAADALARTGAVDAAWSAYAEVTVRYAWSPLAAEARTRAAELNRQAKPPPE